MISLVKVKFAAVLAFGVVGLFAGVAAIHAAATATAPTGPTTAASAPAARQGILDFRIAVLPAEIAAADLAAATDSLNTKGPTTAVKVNDTAARWFEIHFMSKDSLTKGDYVTSTRDGQSYMLCYDDHDHTITHGDPQRKPWSVVVGDPTENPGIGGFMLPFKLDAVGAAYMGELTSANLRRPMAVMLDNCVTNAPFIQSQITDTGVITFGPPTQTRTAGDILKEAQQIKRVMNTTRPADSQPTP